ncbi:amidase [Lentzea waywayandensis]|uniref:Amidase n=1 Tax=Lentzea waywayandensis TaxID=84724 RepID=A0A1I6CTX9_9PSEU|nr:amidase family protein [Lentzea waywayandensis]SFQ96638.1 amidase [Lentzea waywayandensis]
MGILSEQLRVIEALNPVYNALTSVFDVRDEPVGPLAGVTFSVKDNIDVAGAATTHGLKSLAGNVKSADAPIVARLRAAGATPIAHANMPTLNARGMHTYSELAGHTINPWDSALSPGGSSGGDAVAVATGMVDFGIGNDGGGSLRLPAFLNGVCALKPSYGRYPQGAIYGQPDPSFPTQVMTVEGPLARTVEDLRRVHSVLCGADPADPRSVPVPATGSPTPRIAGFVPGDPVVEEAAKRLVEAGYEVEPVTPPRVEEASTLAMRMIATPIALDFEQFATFAGEDVALYSRHLLKVRPGLDLAGFLELTGTRLAIQREWARVLDRYPVLVGPVSTTPWFEPDQDRRSPEALADYFEAMKLCEASSFVGVPSVAVPTGLRDGLPTGVQVISRMYREDLALDAATVLEIPLSPAVSAG